MDDDTIPPDAGPTRRVFISHKHTDRVLADRLRQLIDELSGGDVTTYVSSSVQPEGRRFGTLDGELKAALASAAVVILLYTDPIDNWEYCLWECGVATDPTDATATRVEVFSIGGSVPAPYETSLYVTVGSARSPSDGSSAISDDDRVSIGNFARSFTKSDDFWLDGGGALRKNMPEQTIDDAVDRFLDDAIVLVRHPDLARHRMVELAAAMDPSVATALLPLVERAKDALTWGLTKGPHRELFELYWDRTYVEDLGRVAERQLFFRPPHTATSWERLIDSALDIAHPEGDEEPLIRLVSCEDRNDPLEFWRLAMRDQGAHARAYEQAVRSAANRLFEQHGHRCVERRFLLPSEFFADRPDLVTDFEAIAESMGTAQITVSLARGRNVPPEWRDFAIVGDVAVSRFESVKKLSNRVLKEDFRADEIARARRMWDELKPRWTSLGEQSLAAVLAEQDGFF